MVTSDDIKKSDEFSEFLDEHKEAIKDYEVSQGRVGNHISYPPHPDRAKHDKANRERMRRQALVERMLPHWQQSVQMRKPVRHKKDYGFIAYLIFMVSIFMPIDFGFPLFAISFVWILIIFWGFISRNIFKSAK